MSEQETKTIRGTVSRLFYQSPNFCAGRLVPVRSDVASPGDVMFAGKVYVREGESVALVGHWIDHARFGRQFSVTERLAEQSSTPDDLAAWLQVHGSAHGVGRVKAQRLAKEFGDNFAGWLADDPEQVAIATGVPLETIKALAESWANQQQLNAVGLALAKYELTSNQIYTLYEKFKGSIVAILDEDPYLLLREVPGLGFKKVDAIALKIGVPPDHPGRVTAAFRHCLAEAADDGSTCMVLGDLVDATLEILGAELDATNALVDRLEAAVAEAKVSRLESSIRKWLALPWHYSCEKAVYDFLVSRQGENPHFPTEMPGWVSSAAEKLGSPLDESQIRAVCSALRNRVALISGGAGAGKTTIIRAIANTYRAIGLSVTLCAPTGKAARRIEEMVPGFSAATIHRTLDWRPVMGVGFQRHAGNPLEADVVIVDEVSMLDSELAFRLFDAIDPGTAVVLVGDHHQLPPVGPGALLRDCIQHELLPLSILNQCHRHAGPLKENCAAVLRGEVRPTEPSDGGPGPWYVHQKLYQPADVLAYVERLATSVLTNNLGYDLVRDVQFLTPKHDGPLGTRALNVLLQKVYQKHLGVDVPPPAPGSRPKLLVGDRVIQTKNNYQLDVMNGHQGEVVCPNPLTVRFGDREVAIPADLTGEVELAYCLTPHKCQGSEFPCVVVVAHKSNAFMMHRNWLYTACTRARKTCVLLGDPDGIRRAAERVVNNQRRTLLPLFAAQGQEATRETQP